MKNKPKPTFSWEELDSIRERAGMWIEEGPADAITVEDYCERYGVSRATAAAQLGRLAARGMLMQGFRWKVTPAGRRRIRCYWIE